jgi:hypothetical protein
MHGKGEAFMPTATRSEIQTVSAHETAKCTVNLFEIIFKIYFGTG